MQADTILKTPDNGGEIWYSEQYLKKQIELAFHSGMSLGARVEIHLMQPMSGEAIPDYTKQFWERLNNEYEQRFNRGHAWEMAKGKRIHEKPR